MNKTTGYFLAAMVGGALSTGAFIFHQNQRLDRLEAIEQLRADHLESRASNVKQVSYGLPSETLDFTEAAERTVNAVVHVKTSYELNGGYYSFDPIRHFFFGDGMQQKQPRIGAGAGSGVIMSSDGYIVTNNHVIDGASSVEVVTNNNQSYVAEVVGTDPSSDLALLKIDGSNLPKIDLGNSDQVKVGEWVLAVGNPFNLESTVTAGIVSAKGRDINILANGPDGANAVEAFIQTDAAVNPGNSGGALVNSKGELIGINAAIKSNTGSYTGYSFAIPVNIVTKVVEDLLEFGVVQRGYLGVRIQNVDQKLSELKSLSTREGVYIATTLDLGAAKEAGIKEGDVIVKIAERKVKNVTEMQEQLSRFRPGDDILVTVNRNGSVIDIPLTLRNQFGEEQLTPKNELKLHERLNVLLEDLDEATKQTLEVQNGVRIKELGAGKLKSAGISPDFIILKVDQEAVKNKDHFYDLLKDKTGGVLIEGIYPNGKRAFYGFGL
ncbi:MAG: trypsin-like peptidase domain-containing protein [Cryomorphaceae bacterium]